MAKNSMEKKLDADVKKLNASQLLFSKNPFIWKNIFEEERWQRIFMFVVALIFGPALTLAMLRSENWPLSLKLYLAVVIYLSILFVFFTIYDSLINFACNLIIGKQTKPNILIEFPKFFFMFLTTWLYQYTFIYEPIFHHPRPTNISILLVTNLLYSAIAATIFYKFRQMKDIALKSKVAEAEAQYSLLESQMQPHFLFNSLNVLSELIYVDPDLANAMSQQMADLYREILNNSKSKFSTLESEISILKKYVDIQKIRFGDRIKFEVDVSPAYYNLQIPSLMLQTLVENAIKHGISPKKEGGLIKLSVKKQQNLFEVCISNTGALYKGHKESKRSTGLTNTRNRLELTYGRWNDFKIYSDEERTYVKFMITGRNT
jgi:two-component system, LytTR family, sensor kinase